MCLVPSFDQALNFSCSCVWYACRAPLKRSLLPRRSTWAVAGALPGAACLAAVPLLLYVLDPPEQKETPDAPLKVRSRTLASTAVTAICGSAWRACPPACTSFRLSLPPCQAREELAKLGPLSIEEQLVAVGLGTTLVLWVLGGVLGVAAVAAALAGLAILLVTGARWSAGAAAQETVLCTFVEARFHRL